MGTQAQKSAHWLWDHRLLADAVDFEAGWSVTACVGILESNLFWMTVVKEFRVDYIFHY